jgi:hypothetical protein
MKTKVLAVLAVLFTSTPLVAQNRTPKTEVKGTIAIIGYDEDAHEAVGGSFVYYPAPRVSAEVEALWVRDFRGDDPHEANGFAITPSFGADFRKAPSPFVPYGRLGVRIHRDSWLDRTTALGVPVRRSKTITSLGVHLGFRVYFGERIFVSPELFMGEGLAMKMSLSAGYVTSLRDGPGVGR